MAVLSIGKERWTRAAGTKEDRWGTGGWYELSKYQGSSVLSEVVRTSERRIKLAIEAASGVRQRAPRCANDA